MKSSVYVVMTAVMMMSTSALANFNASAAWQRLDNKALAQVSGQDGSIYTATDPHLAYGHQMIDVLHRLVDQQVTGDINQLTSLFYTNARGQTVLQINQDVVSIGVIELRLNVDGLQDMANTFVSELKLSNPQ